MQQNYDRVEADIKSPPACLNKCPGRIKHKQWKIPHLLQPSTLLHAESIRHKRFGLCSLCCSSTVHVKWDAALWCEKAKKHFQKMRNKLLLIIFPSCLRTAFSFPKGTEGAESTKPLEQIILLIRVYSMLQLREAILISFALSYVCVPHLF